MAIWVFDPEMALAFRRRHRAGVQRARREKRQQAAEKPRDPKTHQLDREWLRAVERDRS